MSRLEYHFRHADWSSLVVVLSALFALAAFACASAQPALPGAGPALTAAVDAGWVMPAAPVRPAPGDHECATCKDCCAKCSKEHDACCCVTSDKCSCVKDPTNDDWRGAR